MNAESIKSLEGLGALVESFLHLTDANDLGTGIEQAMHPL